MVLFTWRSKKRFIFHNAAYNNRTGDSIIYWFRKHKRRSQHHNLKTIYSVLGLLRWKDLWDTWWQFPKKQPSLWGYGKRGGSKEHVSGSWDHSNGWNHLDELDRINGGEIPDKDIKLCNYGQRKRSQKKKKKDLRGQIRWEYSEDWQNSIECNK